MPELPEVEVMRRRLQGRACGRIEGIELRRDNGKYLPGKELEALKGRRMTGDVYRRGKYLTFKLEDRGRLVGHNAMSGYWDTADNPWCFDYVEGKRASTDSDIRVVVWLQDGTALCFHDSRLFGSLRFYDVGLDHDVPCIQRLGIDALKGDLKTVGLSFSLAAMESKKTVKELLMDQSVVAGVGNIYATEALAAAGWHPETPAGRLTLDDDLMLFIHLRRILQEAIDRELRYEEYLRVYRRREHVVCRTKVENVKVAGRSSYFCPRCQPKREG